ncbi:hypothetical protein Syn6312_3006 [Synechococcus sp. PCC 6312]|nr:hypothetical protein Syn6312_3006 [Synechococcus sp. PCC 6312]
MIPLGYIDQPCIVKYYYLLKVILSFPSEWPGIDP